MTSRSSRPSSPPSPRRDRGGALLFVTITITNSEGGKFQARQATRPSVRAKIATCYRTRRDCAPKIFPPRKEKFAPAKISQRMVQHHAEKKFAAQLLSITDLRVLVSAPFSKFIAGFFPNNRLQLRSPSPPGHHVSRPANGPAESATPPGGTAQIADRSRLQNLQRH